jgi:hypothetical protein
MCALTAWAEISRRVLPVTLLVPWRFPYVGVVFSSKAPQVGHLTGSILEELVLSPARISLETGRDLSKLASDDPPDGGIGIPVQGLRNKSDLPTLSTSSLDLQSSDPGEQGVKPARRVIGAYRPIDVTIPSIGET